jgi:hypothetical protein
MASRKKTVNDVANPSKTAAEPTSRPIIVGHGPMIADPTLKKSEKTDQDQDGQELEPAAAKLAARRKDKVIAAPQPAKPKDAPADDKPPEDSPEPVDEPDEQAAETPLEAPATEEAPPDSRSKNKKDNSSNAKGAGEAVSKEEQARQAAGGVQKVFLAHPGS